MSAVQFQLPAQVTSGIYHLLDETGAALYVGQTSDFYSRLSGHPLRRIAAEVRFFPAPIDELNALEAQHIREYTPRFNRAGLTSEYIPILKKRRGFLFKKECFATAGEFLARFEFVSIPHLRALGLLKNSSQLPELLATGFPEPAIVRRNNYRAWRTADIRKFLDREQAGRGTP